jgi:hypothetical protein
LDLHGWGFIGATAATGPAWAHTFGDRFIRRVTDIQLAGNSLLAVALGSVSATSDDADSPPVLWLLKLDLAGNVLRARAFVTSDGFAMPRVVATTAGPVVVGVYAGDFDVSGKILSTRQPADVFVLAANEADFSPRWAQSLGGNAAVPGGHAVLSMANGEVLVTCGTCVNPTGNGLANSDDYGPGMVRLSADGTRKAVVSWASTGAVRVNAATFAHRQQAIVVGGAFTKKLTIAASVSASASAAFDGFVLQVAAP